MLYLVDSEQMKQIDHYTVEEIGIPAIVLMEKAALAVAKAVVNISGDKDQILVVCGTGNNGADGIATARLLHSYGFNVSMLVVGKLEKATSLFLQQFKIAKNLGISMDNKLEINEYTIIVDAIFGVGLNRDLDDDMNALIGIINAAGKKIVSVDIPSGLSADTGKAMGSVINAFITVTFGFLKIGLILYPGCEYVGKIQIADIGFADIALKSTGHRGYIYEKKDLNDLPKRIHNSNKGTFGKVLVIAGSKEIYGACFLSAKAAYKTGAGLVKVITPACNKSMLNTNLPEALIYTYDGDKIEDIQLDNIKEMLEWASVIVMGPGMGFADASQSIFQYVIQNAHKPLILDADAIQMLGRMADENLDNNENITIRIDYFNRILPRQTILTPHVKELSDLLKISVNQIKDNIMLIADTCTFENQLIYIMKDARTIVATDKKRYINITGNNGMATGGSGDVLTGIIAGLIAQGLSPDMASELGVYVHSLAGDIGSEKYGEYALLASDMIEMLPFVMKENKLQVY